MSKFCTKCGTQAEDTDRICRQCGNPFPEAAVNSAAPAAPVAPEAPVAPASPVAPTPAAPVAPVAPVPPVAPAAPKQGKGKAIIISVIAVILVAAIATTGVILYKKGVFGGDDSGSSKKDKEKTSESTSSSGYKSAVDSFMKATIDCDAKAMKKVLSAKYDDEADDVAKELVGDAEDLEGMKITYSIKKAKDVSSDMLEDICDETGLKVKNAKIVTLELKIKDKESGDTDTMEYDIIFTEEKGSWKYYEFADMGEDYDDEDYDDEDYDDEDYDDEDEEDEDEYYFDDEDDEDF